MNSRKRRALNIVAGASSSGFVAVPNSVPHVKATGRSAKASKRPTNYVRLNGNVYSYSQVAKKPLRDRPMCNCDVLIGCDSNCLNMELLIECSPMNCPTGRLCDNQRIQRHKNAPGLEFFMTANKGWGVKTTKTISEATFIIEYIGEVMSVSEFNERLDTIYSNEVNHYSMHLDKHTVVDCYRKGNMSRFVNHSCDPNCEMQKWKVAGRLRLALFAIRDIEENEEITFDYNLKKYSNARAQRCYCGAANCRGTFEGKVN